MPHIVRPITDDGLVGYDQFGQLSVTKKDGDFEDPNRPDGAPADPSDLPDLEPGGSHE